MSPFRYIAVLQPESQRLPSSQDLFSVLALLLGTCAY